MAARVAVLHHPRSFFPLDLAGQVGDGVDLLWVVDGSADPTTIRLLQRIGSVVDIGGLGYDDAAARIEPLAPDGIVSFVDDRLVAGAELAGRLGLRFHTPAVAADLVDKRRQRSILHHAGVPGPRFGSLPAAARGADVEAAAAEVGFPAVLKPAEGSGSRGIQRVASLGQLLALLSNDAGIAHVIEEYLPDAPWTTWAASYLSVESVVVGGTVRHVATTGRFPLADPFRETGNFIPALLPPDLGPPALDLAAQAIRSLGVVDAVVHTEIKVTDAGLRLIEVNGRLGGRPPFVLRRVSDVNLFRAACDVAVGDDPGVPELPEVDGVGFWLMLQPPVAARRVRRVAGLEELSDVVGVESIRLDRPPGAQVDWREGTAAAVVTIEGRVADHDDLAKTVDACRQGARIDYE